jgi:hypothetical protein
MCVVLPICMPVLCFKVCIWAQSFPRMQLQQQKQGAGCNVLDLLHLLMSLPVLTN